MWTLIGGLIVAYIAYIVLTARKNDKPSADPPTMAHATLRVVVDRAIEEARRLPGLSAPADDKRPQEGGDVADRSYEDLLATAILNKVIERFQKERVDGNSNVLHEACPTKHALTGNEHDFEEDVGNCGPRSFKSSSDDGTSVRRSGNHRAPVSFIMEERIEEVTTITSGGDNDALEFGRSRRVPFPELGMDIVEPPRELPSPSSDSSDSNSNEERSSRRVGMKRYRATSRPIDLVSPIESWEDNWLFQKRKTGRSQPGAVVMLVPSSNACYKALIGDRDAEDTSDLSECSSTKSDEEIERELMEAINNVVPRTPKTSECNAGDNQEVPNDATRLEEVEEVDEARHVEARTENNAAVGEHFGEGGGKETRVSKEKTVEREDNKDNKSKQARSCLATKTSAKRVGNEIREKSKDTSKCRGRAIMTAVESSVQEDVKVHRETSSQRSDRGNAVDEGEEQRDGEYTEHYDTAIQRHLDSLTKTDVCSEQCETIDRTKKKLAEEESSELQDKSIEKQESERSEAKVQLPYAMVEDCIDMTAESDRLSTPPRPGTIAEREHKKWENAPPIKNNPYSEESIRKRSWERRYSRKPADIPGTHYEITKMNEEANSEALLTPDLPDIKRFGRDYYINQSRKAGEERAEQAKSAVSSSSRASGSQRPSCANNDEQREQEEAKDTDSGLVHLSREDKDTKTTASRWRNNAEVITPSETNNRAVSARASVDIDRQTAISDKNVVERQEGATSKVQQTDDILEDQRKNSKNEINAKLNNQEHNLEAECENDKERKVRKIDLKAYGFENEFPDQRDARRQQRVVNRLDLRSFGYQDSLRRTRSNNQLDQPTSNNEKSNLTRCVIGREGDFVGGSKGRPVGAPKSLGDPAKSSHKLNVLRDKIEKVDSLISAKSMPNVADDVYYYANPVRVSDDDDEEEEEKEENELIARNLLDRASDRSEEGATDMRNDGSLSGYDEIPSDVDKSFEDIYIRSKEPCRESDDEKLAMPSVKKLAEAFSGRQAPVIEAAPVKINRALMTDDSKNGLSTPEVQVVEAPRQMHSLTARSLSKEFREGLRQKTARATSPSVNRSLMEERPGIVRAKQSKDSDTAVISPGKLKSNIIFWEQMQKRN